MNDAPRIEFPCDYPVKIVGDHSPAFVSEVTRVVREHAPDLTDERISVRMSRQSTYCSVTCVIVATGETQLRALHATLRARPDVRIVL